MSDHEKNIKAPRQLIKNLPSSQSWNIIPFLEKHISSYVVDQTLAKYSHYYLGKNEINFNFQKRYGMEK